MVTDLWLEDRLQRDGGLVLCGPCWSLVFTGGWWSPSGVAAVGGKVMHVHPQASVGCCDMLWLLQGISETQST